MKIQNNQLFSKNYTPCIQNVPTGLKRYGFTWRIKSISNNIVCSILLFLEQ